MSDKSLHVRVLPEIPGDPQLASRWNDLVMRMECPEVFYTYQWAAAAAQALQSTVSPLLFLVFDSDQLCGIAPFATRPGSPGTAFFLTASSADYCDILSEPDQRRRVLAALFPEIARQGIHELELANLPSDSATLRELPGCAESQGFRLHRRPAYDCQLIVFGTEHERQQLLAAVRHRRHKKRDLRIERLGDVRLVDLSGDQVHNELRSIFSAHISRFLAAQRVSPLVRPERRLLLDELARRLGEAGWLRVSRLEIDGRSAAWHLGFRFRDSAFWYLPTFAMEYEDLSPGAYLLRLVIEDSCCDTSLERMDLGLGDEAYKDRYANAVRSTSYVRLTTSRLGHWRNVVRHWLSRNVQRSRAAELSLRKLRDFGRDLRTRVRTSGLAGVGAHILGKAVGYVRSSEEGLLFEAPAIEPRDGRNVRLIRLDWQQIADIAMENADDPESLQYLMCCAARLRAGDARGFVMRGPESPAYHLLWVEPYDGFYLSEIKGKLRSSDPAAAMIFDCWTPPSQRGHGYYADALRLAAAYLQREQKHAWVFCSVRNQNSSRGISKAGFVPRTCLVRKSWFGRAVVSRHPATEA